MTGAAAPRARGGPTPTARHQDNLTHVELTWVEKKIENWIRFGTHAHEQILDRRRRVQLTRPIDRPTGKGRLRLYARGTFDRHGDQYARRSRWGGRRSGRAMGRPGGQDCYL